MQPTAVCTWNTACDAFKLVLIWFWRSLCSLKSLLVSHWFIFIRGSNMETTWLNENWNDTLSRKRIIKKRCRVIWDEYTGQKHRNLNGVMMFLIYSTSIHWFMNKYSWIATMFQLLMIMQSTYCTCKVPKYEQ